jgi:hypothetical protein
VRKGSKEYSEIKKHRMLHTGLKKEKLCSETRKEEQQRALKGPARR